MSDGEINALQRRQAHNQTDTEQMSEIADMLLQLFDGHHGPFPRNDCHTIIASARVEIANSGRRDTEVSDDTEIGGFVPDLALYDTEISGLASWGKRTILWDVETTKMAEKITNRSFFEKHPEYQILQNKITPDDTPALYEYIVFQEAVRTGVLQILALLAARKSRT